jgi:hypothetical protein
LYLLNLGGGFSTAGISSRSEAWGLAGSFNVRHKLRTSTIVVSATIEIKVPFVWFRWIHSSLRDVKIISRRTVA